MFTLNMYKQTQNTRPM